MRQQTKENKAREAKLHEIAKDAFATVSELEARLRTTTRVLAEEVARLEAELRAVRDATVTRPQLDAAIACAHDATLAQMRRKMDAFILSMMRARS